MSVWYFPRPRLELFIDLDNYMRPAPSRSGESKGPWGEVFFRRRLADAIEAGVLPFSRLFLDHSNSEKHWHAIVVLAEPGVSLLGQLAWQQRLGSDLMRCQADLMRFDKGVKHPSLLIRNKPMTDFYRPPDRECACTKKHDTAEQMALNGKGCPVWHEFRGMTPWQLFGPTNHEPRWGAMLPIGEVPLELILSKGRIVRCPFCNAACYSAREAEEHCADIERELCEFCGGPEPCDKRACMDALLSLADFYEEEIAK